MDESSKHHNPNPVLSANPISQIFFWWLNPLFKKGYVRQLEIEDMYNVARQDQSDVLGQRLETEWQKEIANTKDGKRKPSLFRALFRMFGLEYILLGFVLLLEESTKVIQPLLLGGLIRYFTPNSEVTKFEGYLYAGGVSLCAIVLAVAHHPYFFGVQRIGMQMRVACCSLLYRKALRLSNAGMSKTTTGQIVNLMSNDVNRFDQAVIFLHFLWIGPLEAIVVLAILWRELGPSTLAGFAVLLFLVPLQGWMGKLFSKFRQKTAKHTDERVRVMNEIISGMRVIKMYCWEKPFGDLVAKIRKEETKKVRTLGYIRGLILGPFFVSVKLICLMVFVCFVLTGGQLRTETVFVATALYTSVRLATVLFMSFAIQFISETQITFDRIQNSSRRQLMQTTNLPSMQRVKKTMDSLLELGIQYKKYCLTAFLKTFGRVGRLLSMMSLLVCLTLTHWQYRAPVLYLALGLISVARFAISRVTVDGWTDLMELNVTLERAKWRNKFNALKLWKRHPTLVHFFKTWLKHLIPKALIWRKRNEIGLVWKSQRQTAFLANIWTVGPRSLFFAVVLMATLIGHSIRAQSLYVGIPLLQVLAHNMMGMIGLFVRCASEVIQSKKRIATFLNLEELDLESDSKDEGLVPLKDCLIQMDNITAKWDEAVDQHTLQKVSAVVSPGKLLAVIGPVGAGKSSLLMSVLKELPVSEGSVSVKGRIAYVAQQPWVFSASLRQNVVFGNKYEKAKYDRILKACALNKDVDIMPHGDLTLIGDRGVSLSGGQRARVSLARALYMEADVYLLDDPLSAVDAAVGRHIFTNVIQGLLKDKPRILVTHQLQFLKEASEILILKDGEMIGKGNFKDLSVSGIDFASLLKHDKEEEEEKSHDPHHRTTEKMFDHLNGHPHGIVRHRSRVDSSCSKHSITNKGSMMSLTSIGTEFEAEMVQLPEEEERRQGTVTGRIYLDYFMAGAGVLKFIVLILLCLLAQGAYIASDWWLSYWSNQEEARYAAIERDNELRLSMNRTSNMTSNLTTGVIIPYVDTHLNVGIFSAIIGSVFLFGLLRALMFFKVTVDASQHLHNEMFDSILRTNIGFFDTNPVGRILNRFTKDIGQMDDILPVCFFDFVQCSLLILGIVIVAGVVNPFVFIPVIPLIIFFVIIRRYYLRTSRHIKRLEGTTRSPVYSHLSASLQGLHTIRAFGVGEKFVDEFDSHQDLHTEAWFLFLSTSRWLAVRLDWLCALFVTAVSFCCILAADRLNAGLVGLSMTYAMTLMGMFQWGVRQSAEVENQMISVERVIDYSKLPSEAPLEVDEKKQPPPDWPDNGVIMAENVGLKYAEDLPLVLKDLTFTIRAREKVGIVGRTGAGKSSLITMLFRLVEPIGVVMIDNINVHNIGLHDLRKHISIIPQDPVLFTGTLRRNLDPFSNHSDEALWRALEEVQLKQAIEDLPHGVDSEVSEGGVNFSVGQRQLICLARAVLRNNKILMIDEATANVDPRTDALIQQTIREKFSKCTVLTIAHRLHTIMDSDRIMVLDSGHIEEFDAPHLLMQKPDGLLRKLVEQTGKSETIHLLEIAKNAYEKRENNGEPDSIRAAGENIGMSSHDVSIAIDEKEEAEVADKASTSSESGSESSKPKNEDTNQSQHTETATEELNESADKDNEKESVVAVEPEDEEHFDESTKLISDKSEENAVKEDRDIEKVVDAPKEKDKKDADTSSSSSSDDSESSDDAESLLKKD